MKISTISKNQKREIIIIKDETSLNYTYAWIEGIKLTIVDVPFQRVENKLVLTKEQLNELFPSLIIDSYVMLQWNNRLNSLQVIPVIQ